MYKMIPKKNLLKWQVIKWYKIVIYLENKIIKLKQVIKWYKIVIYLENKIIIEIQQ